MEKILEVLRYGEYDIRFNTDIDVTKNPDLIMDVNREVLFTMLTKLWGGNELSVLAMIRALAIADLAASDNPDEMLEHFSESAHYFKQLWQEACDSIVRSGGKVLTFPPIVKPNKANS